jgi:hypothetical protein
MKDASAIVRLIAGCIEKCYGEPELAVRDLGELDAVLFHLHWLYASANDELGRFVEARSESFRQSLEIEKRILDLKDANVIVNCREDAAILIDQWRAVDRRLDWRFDR